MNWEKIEKTVNSEGTTITYEGEGTNRQLLVQSRKRHIPHANGIGTWDCTTYHIICRGQEAKKTYRAMKDAKEDAEIWWKAVFK